MAGSVQAGDILRQKYRVERILGQGGMGVVVAAWHLRLEQRVAIKFLRPEMLQDADLVERFLREARAASKIEGEHVARVLDVDTLESGAPFLVMEYLEGADLSSVRRRKKPLPLAEAVSYVLQACEAITEAHSLGIIHRDLKPANLFLAKKRSGRIVVKVLDFGISKIADTSGGDEAGITKTAMVMGSAEYMSPEQMLSTRDVDERTDIWALGTILYELCTARGPFRGTTMAQVCAHVMSTDPPAPRSLCPEIPAELEAIILRCLQKDRARRFASVAELSVALELFAPTTARAPFGSMPEVGAQAPVGVSASMGAGAPLDPGPAAARAPLDAAPAAAAHAPLRAASDMVDRVPSGAAPDAVPSAQPVQLPPVPVLSPPPEPSRESQSGITDVTLRRVEPSLAQPPSKLPETTVQAFPGTLTGSTTLPVTSTRRSSVTSARTVKLYVIVGVLLSVAGLLVIVLVIALGDHTELTAHDTDAANAERSPASSSAVGISPSPSLFPSTLPTASAVAVPSSPTAAPGETAAARAPKASVETPPPVRSPSKPQKSSRRMD